MPPWRGSRSRQLSSRPSSARFEASSGNLRRLALTAAAFAALIALLLWQQRGFDGEDAVLTLLLLGPPAIVFFFAQGVAEIASLPDRVRRMPGEGQERLGELTRVAGQARDTRLGTRRSSSGGCAGRSARSAAWPGSRCR